MLYASFKSGVVALGDKVFVIENGKLEAPPQVEGEILRVFPDLFSKEEPIKKEE